VKPGFRRHLDVFGPARMAALLEPWVGEDRRRRIEAVLENRIKGVTVVMVGLHDPHNGAAVIRTAEAMGLQEVWTVEDSEPYRLSSKVTRGCHRWVTVNRFRDFETCTVSLRLRGYALWAAIPGTGVPADRIRQEGPLALVFGNERDGLKPEVVERCEGSFHLPMRGFTGSYNLSVSVALSLSEVVSHFRAGLPTTGDLTPEDRELLRARWLYQMVRAADQILEREAETAEVPED